MILDLTLLFPLCANTGYNWADTVAVAEIRTKFLRLIGLFLKLISIYLSANSFHLTPVRYELLKMKEKFFLYSTFNSPFILAKNQLRTRTNEKFNYLPVCPMSFIPRE